MMTRRYLATIILAMGMLMSACSDMNAPAATPFRKYSAQNVLDVLTAAGTSVLQPISDKTVPPDAPPSFSERYTFQIERIAPEGGAVIVFGTAENLQNWQAYVERLRGNSTTRRQVVYVYFKDNAVLQLSPSLTNDEAAVYRDVFNAMP